MAGSFTTLNILDGGGTSRTMRVWDESGTGTGPYSFGQMLVSGTGSVKLSGTSGILIDSTQLASLVTTAQAMSVGYQLVGLPTDQPAVPMKPAAATTGGPTPSKALSAASTNATSLKASAGQLYHVSAINTTATVYYLKFYNKASAPTVGTDVPVWTFPVPANTAGAGLVMNFPIGAAFSTGIAWALTGGTGLDADTNNAATGVTINFLSV